MKNQWWAYATVAIISAVAGVAIAGLPNTVARDDTIVIPTPTSTTTIAPATTETPGSDTQTDESDADGPDGDADPETDSQDRVTTTTTTTTTTAAPIDRAEIDLVVINGAGVAGLATRTRNALIDQGFEAARATDGDVLVDFTTVYFAPGNEQPAGIVAVELGIDPFSIQPVENAPGFGVLDGDEVFAYLGRDRS